MSELSFEQMLEESLKTIRTGEVVTGKVIDVNVDNKENRNKRRGRAVLIEGNTYYVVGDNGKMRKL